MYRKIGKIESCQDIPWDKEIIISGSIGKNTWLWRMSGIFKACSDNRLARFIDEHGVVTPFNEKDFLSLSILEKEK